MSENTVDPLPLRAPARASGPGESLRERKKRQTRQMLSDTATEMFLARGFDRVRVSEIAAACGVSEKTVFNYFPTKEALVMDRLDGVSDALLAALADPQLTPIQAALRVLAGELAGMAGLLAARPDFRHAARQFQRFGALLRSTPSLRAHQHAVTERLTAEASHVLAERTGAHPDDPEPRIVAAAVLALWPVQFHSLERRLDSAESVDDLTALVTSDVHRAARALENGASL